MVELNPRQKIIHIATNEGWQELVGFIGKVGDLKVTVTAMLEDRAIFGRSAKMIISEFNSGFKIYEFPINLIEIKIDGETEEGTMMLFKEKMQMLEDYLTELKMFETVQKMADDNSKSFVEEWGEMPPVKDFEGRV